MADIFNIKDERQKRERETPPNGSYFVRVDVYEDGVAGAVLDMGDDLSPEELRGVANHLATLSRWLRDQAADADGNMEEDLLAEFRVFKSSRVWANIDEEMTTPEQVSWMIDRLDDAKKIVGP